MFANDSRQLIGPVAVIATVACAEFSAALGTWPSSSILWYLNLEAFRVYLQVSCERAMS